MNNNMPYSDDDLDRRIEELLADGGESYIPGEDARLDAMMRLSQAEHPALTPAQINGIEAGLGLMNAPEPQLSFEAFASIEAAILTQFQLQNAPQVEMPDEALDRIETQMRLQNAPQVEMPEEVFLRIEQQLLQAMPAPATTLPYWMIVVLSASVFVLSWFGFSWVVDQVTDENIETPTGVVEDNVVVDDIADTPLAYIYGADWGDIAAIVEPSVDAVADEPAVVYESQTVLYVIPTELPEIVENNFPASPEINLPPRVVVEGTIDSIDGKIITVFGMPFEIGDGSEAEYLVGDMVSIEGIVNPNKSETYLVLTIGTADERGEIERPVLAIYSGGSSDEPDTIAIVSDTTSGSSGSDSGSSVTSVPAPNTASVTTTSTSEQCEDDDSDRDQGRGNNCNGNNGNANGNANGRP